MKNFQFSIFNFQLRWRQWMPWLILIVFALLLTAPNTVSAHDIGSLLPHPTGTCPADFDAASKGQGPEPYKTWCNREREPNLGFCQRPKNPKGTTADLTPIPTNVECNYSLCDGIQIFVNVARWALGISGSLALLMFVLGGFSLIRSKGEAGTETNPGGITKAKSTLKNALIGLIIIIAAWQIVNAIIIFLTAPNDWTSQTGVAQILTQSWSNICTIKK